MLNAMANGRQINSTQTTIRVDHLAIFVLNKIQDLYLSTELLCRPRTDGFLMLYGVDPRFHNVASRGRELNPVYAQLEEERMNKMKAVFNEVLDERVQQRRAGMPTPEFLESMSMVVDREFAHKNTQPDIENPPPMGMEPWVRQLSSPDVEKFGFLIYRLSYGESEEEWANTKDMITKRIESGWEGVVGGEGVKGKAVLRWMDGRKVKIEEGDLDGARAYVLCVLFPGVFLTDTLQSLQISNRTKRHKPNPQRRYWRSLPSSNPPNNPLLQTSTTKNTHHKTPTFPRRFLTLHPRNRQNLHSRRRALIFYTTSTPAQESKRIQG